MLRITIELLIEKDKTNDGYDRYKTLYEQSVNELDIPALVQFINKEDK